MVKQTGLLFELRPKDFVLGALDYEEINPSGDWRPFLPPEERQSTLTFDSMSCATFSATNVIETQINFFIQSGKLPAGHLKKLNDLGFMQDGKINISDRFTAIMSGTTPQGNYFQNVWDSIRKDGMLSELDFPMQADTFAQYHDKNRITVDMKNKAKKILELFSFAYEWSSLEKDVDISKPIKQAPLQGGIPFPAYHAVELPTVNYIFDTYKPFLYERQVPLHFSLKGVVTIIKEVIVAPSTPVPVLTPIPTPSMPFVTINRFSDDGVQTLGDLTFGSFKCKTLEKPWRLNERNVSCIPRGEYIVKWRWFMRKMKYAYMVQNVPNRDGIFFHSGNFFFDIKGCIILGDKYGDINHDAWADIMNSKITISKFDELLSKRIFKLIIT